MQVLYISIANTVWGKRLTFTAQFHSVQLFHILTWITMGTYSYNLNFSFTFSNFFVIGTLKLEKQNYRCESFFLDAGYFGVWKLVFRGIFSQMTIKQ